MIEKQARSRLKPKPSQPTLPAPKLVAPQISKYWRYSSCLLIGLLSYFLLYLLLSKVYPSQVQNLLWPNSYLPCLGLLFSGNFFLFTFILLNKKLGLVFAFAINLLFYLRLNHIVFDSFAWLMVLATSALLFLLVHLPAIRMVRKKQK